MSMPLTFLTGAAIAALAFAAPQGEGNKGPITLEEMKLAADARFEKMDTDGDGYLSDQDRPDPAARFAMADADSSGVIEKEEFLGAALSRFDKQDANGNGVIDEDERPQAEGRRGGGPKGKDRGGRPEMTRDNMEAMVVKRFDRLDTNKNGELSEEEFSSARGDRVRGKGHKPDMSALDTDGDNRISKAEHDAAVEQRFATLDTDNDGVVTDEERRAAKDGRKEGKDGKKNR